MLTIPIERISVGTDKLTKEEVKEALKEAIKEWLDKQFLAFGKWSLKALGSVALALALYTYAKIKGWIQ